MKLLLMMLLLWMFCLTPIYADSFVVMDGEDYTVYKEQGMHTQQSIASVSKIMTAIVAIEKGYLADQWILGKEIENSYGSMIYLEQGQQVNLIDLLYGLLLESGNDAADAIAYHVGGNQSEQFILWMNELAKELHMQNTVYRNPSGLDEDDGGNVSTPYDQALLMAYALKNDVFQQMTATKYYTTQGNQQYVNHNKLLWNFSYAIGGKNGYTLMAQHTLTTAARKEDITCIVVSFHMGEETMFHKEQYIDFYNHIDAYPIISKQVVKIEDELIVVDEPFVIHGTEDEFQQGELTLTMDEENQQLQVEWKTDMRTVYAYYPYV